MKVKFVAVEAPTNDWLPKGTTLIDLSLVTEATFVGGVGASGTVARVKVPIPLYS